MASHQLRTPLTSIKGYISMILEGDYGQIPEKTKKALQNVFQSNERLIGIVNDLLNISRIELGKMELKTSPTKIEQLLQSCSKELKPQAEKKNLKLIFKPPKTPLPTLNIDQLKIRQVILNLIDNAIRYTKEGTITIKVQKTKNSILISIKDTGEGLTREEQKHIFEGFTRGSAGINFFIEGAGLGLYVAKKYLDLHNGKIWAESPGKGKGSTFYVELPIR
jgi:signal transduction histidine kinase